MIMFHSTSITLLIALSNVLLHMPMTTLAYFPLIVEDEGFDVDLEPFSVQLTYTTATTNRTALQEALEDAIRMEMRAALPNLLGVLFQTYEDPTAIGESEKNHVFYTGATIFKGPPYRTNHEVYLAQTNALSTFPADSLESILGVPSWFNRSRYPEDPNDPSNPSNNPFFPLNGDNDGSVGDEASAAHLLLGAVVGCMVGVSCLLAAMYCANHKNTLLPFLFLRRKSRKNDDSDEEDDLEHQSKMKHGNQSSSSFGSTGNNSRKKFSKKTSNIYQDDDDDEDGLYCNGDDDENRVEASPVRNRKHSNSITNAPASLNIPNGSSQPNHKARPLKRRDSHHRRWKSTTFGNDFSGAAAAATSDEELATTPNNKSTTPNHRRSNSLGVHLTDAIGMKRRDSMADLLGTDEYNSNGGEYEDDFVF